MLTTASGIESDKTSLIVQAASQEFYEKGFRDTSLSDISRRSGVKRQAIMNNYQSKTELFLEVMERHLATYKQKISVLLNPDDPLRENLFRLATGYLEFITSPPSINLMRICLTEQAMFPELAKGLYASGPKQGLMALERVLRDESTSGYLVIEDTYEAANNFFALCRGDFFYHVLLCPDIQRDESRLEAEVNRVVDMFFRAYVSTDRGKDTV